MSKYDKECTQPYELKIETEDATSSSSNDKDTSNLQVISANRKNGVKWNVSLENEEKLEKLLNDKEFLKEDISDILDSPFTEDDFKRIEEIMSEDITDKKVSDSYTVISQLKNNSAKLQRVREIDEMLVEMKADGHAYINNLMSKRTSKNIDPNKTLDDLKADMNKIDEMISANRTNHKKVIKKNYQLSQEDIIDLNLNSNYSNT